jgi:hypothetical protein
MSDFHKVLKTGCSIEVRRQQTVGAMWNLLGILTPMAMRLLWLRQVAQTAPDTPATEVVSQEIIYVVTKLDKRSRVTLTASDLWRTVASFGGYLNRKCDDPPGWQTECSGWLYVQTVLEARSSCDALSSSINCVNLSESQLGWNHGSCSSAIGVLGLHNPHLFHFSNYLMRFAWGSHSFSIALPNRL